VANINNMFDGCTDSLLINGLVNLGKNDIGDRIVTFKFIYNITSIENIINNLYDRKTADKSEITLVFERGITQEYIDIAKNKGWIIE